VREADQVSCCEPHSPPAGELGRWWWWYGSWDWLWWWYGSWEGGRL